MGKLILGFVLGFILSDAITNKYPKAQQFKISPKTLENLFPPIETKQQVKGFENVPRLLVNF